jgi:hypothetical protein
MSPNQAWALPLEEQRQRNRLEEEYNAHVDAGVTSISPGDRVRVLENVDAAFVKGTKPKWSTKVYTVEARAGYRYRVSGLSARYKPNALLLVGETAQDLVVDTSATKQEKVRKKITSRKEGIAVDEHALAGQAQPRACRAKKEARTLRELDLKVGEFVVLDAESAADEPIKLLVTNPRKRRTKGYVWAGWVTRRARGKLYLRFLRGHNTRTRALDATLELSADTEAVSTGVHADRCSTAAPTSPSGRR